MMSVVQSNSKIQKSEKKFKVQKERPQKSNILDGQQESKTID